MINVDEILAPPFHERKRLCLTIHKSLLKESEKKRLMDNQTWCDKLMELSASAIGLPDIHQGRNKRHVVGRMLVAYELRREGFSLHHIGKMMNKDHSTIQYLTSAMSDAFNLPKMYVDELSAWDRFQKLIINETDTRTV